MAGLVVKVPVADAAKVAAVGFLGLQVKVLEDIRHVVPVLHEQGIRMIHYHDFDRRQEVMIALLGTITELAGCYRGGCKRILTRPGP